MSTTATAAHSRRPDHHSARPRFDRDARKPALVARRPRRGDRTLQCAVGDLPARARPFSSRASARSATARRPSWPTEIKAFTTQEVIHSREHVAFNRRASRRRLRPDEAGSSGSSGGWRSAESSARRSSASRRPWRWSISPPSSRTNCSPTRATSTGAEPRGGGAVALACERGDRAQGRRLRHLAARDPRLAAVQALEGQGEGDAATSPATSSSTGPRARSSCCARTASPGCEPGRGCCGTCGSGPGMFRKIAGAWSRYFLPGFHPWNEDDRAADRRPTMRAPRRAAPAPRREGAAARPRPPALPPPRRRSTPPARSRKQARRGLRRRGRS